MCEVRELLRVLDKVDTTNGSSIFTADARKKRREINIFLIQNKTITPTQVSPAPKKKSPNKISHRQNWLAQ